MISPMLCPDDMEKISQHLKITKEKFKKEYLKKTMDGSFQFKKTPCPFLQQNKCNIYKVQPKNCKHYLHNDISLRCIQFFANAEICPIAYNVLENTKIILFEEIYDNEFELIFQKNYQ
jgi:Fe-S-cluster containining protein